MPNANADNLQDLRQQCAKRLRDKLLDPSLRAQKAASLQYDVFYEEVRGRSFVPEKKIPLSPNGRTSVASVSRRHPEVPPLPLRAKGLTQERAQSATVPRRTPVSQAVQIRTQSTGRGYDRPTASSIAAVKAGQRESVVMRQQGVPPRFPSNFWGNGIAIRENSQGGTSPLPETRSISPISRGRQGNPPERSGLQVRQGTSQTKVHSPSSSPKGNNRHLRLGATSVPRTRAVASADRLPSHKTVRVQSSSPPPRQVGSAPHAVRSNDERHTRVSSGTNSKRLTTAYMPENFKQTVNRLHQGSTIAGDASNIYQNGTHGVGSQGNFLLDDDKSIDSISLASNSTFAHKVVSPSPSTIQHLLDENATLREAFLDANRRLKQLEEEKSSFFTEGVFELANSVCSAHPGSFDLDASSRQLISRLRKPSIDTSGESSSPVSRRNIPRDEIEMGQSLSNAVSMPHDEMEMARSLSTVVASARLVESQQRTAVLSDENAELRRELQSASELRDVLEQQQRAAEDRMHKLEEDRAFLAQRLAHCVAVADAGNSHQTVPPLDDRTVPSLDDRTQKDDNSLHVCCDERMKDVHVASNSNASFDRPARMAEVFLDKVQINGTIQGNSPHAPLKSPCEVGEEIVETGTAPSRMEETPNSELSHCAGDDVGNHAASRTSVVSTTELLGEIEQSLVEATQDEISPSATSQRLSMIDIEDAW